MIKKDKVLICLPTFHPEQGWLERAINSVEMQTYEYFDCFIVKDSCNNKKEECIECELCKNTIEYCKKVTKDKRFKFFNLPINSGAAGWGPRNFAIMNSNNNLISYLDDDNWYEPNHLELLVGCMGKDINFAYTGSNLIDTHGKIIKKRLKVQKPTQGDIDTSEILHKRELVIKHGGWHKVKKCNDWDLIARWTPSIVWSHTKEITLNFFLRENCGIHRETL